ncbi:hypothetical protein GVAV_000977 [Gurleya vavrai]
MNNRENNRRNEGDSDQRKYNRRYNSNNPTRHHENSLSNPPRHHENSISNPPRRYGNYNGTSRYQENPNYPLRHYNEPRYQTQRNYRYQQENRPAYSVFARKTAFQGETPMGNANRRFERPTRRGRRNDIPTKEQLDAELLRYKNGEKIDE